MKQQNKTKGFTIIEVVLVLAIAGLIFLMVFIALPALQRNQRDTARKNVIGSITSQMNNYQSNSRGKVPANQTQLNTFTQGYLGGTGNTSGDEYTDPQYDNLAILFRARTLSPGNGQVFYSINSKCGTGGAADAATGARNYTFRIKLENGGFACQGSN